MILYYALGGGLGHMARAFALVAHAPERIRDRIRLLVSALNAPSAIPLSPCPVDTVPARAMSDRGKYLQFMAEHLLHLRVRCIVMDTFPFGLMGEFVHLTAKFPRVLVGRYLRWDAYHERCGDATDALWPKAAIMIEEQDERYLRLLKTNGDVIPALWPISLAVPERLSAPPDRPRCCVVHSGPQSELEALLSIACRIRDDSGAEDAPEIFTPKRGVFPLEHHLSCFTDVISGAGYASSAASLVLKSRIRYHLTPFPRRFDDQVLRLKRLQDGAWPDASDGGTARAAALLWNTVEALLPPQ